MKRTWNQRKGATGYVEGPKFSARNTCRLVDSCSKRKKNKQITQPFKLTTKLSFSPARLFHRVKPLWRAPDSRWLGTSSVAIKRQLQLWRVDRTLQTSLVPCQEILRFRVGTCDQGFENCKHAYWSRRRTGEDTNHWESGTIFWGVCACSAASREEEVWLELNGSFGVRFKTCAVIKATIHLLKEQEQLRILKLGDESNKIIHFQEGSFTFLRIIS